MVPTRAYEKQLYVAYANRCGSEGQTRYYGESCVCAPDGRDLARAKPDSGVNAMPTPSPKSVIVISPTSTTNGATTTGSFDTKGFDYAVIDVCATTSNNATNNFSVLTLSEGDTTSSYAAASTGDTDFTIAASDTAADQVVAQFRVDMRGRKRYLKLSASPVTTQTITAVAHLHRADQLAIASTG